MTERQKMFLEIAESLYERVEANGSSGFICIEIERSKRSQFGDDDTFQKMIWPYAEATSAINACLYDSGEEAEDAKARIVLCCLLAAMTDKEYEELTK